MPAWYDIRDLESDRSSTREDLDGVEASTKVLESLIEIEARELQSAGGKSRLMIGGFSQGGARVALAWARRGGEWRRKGPRKRAVGVS